MRQTSRTTASVHLAIFEEFFESISGTAERKDMPPQGVEIIGRVTPARIFAFGTVS